MTSFGATNVIRDNFMPTFRVPRANLSSNGIDFTVPNEEPKFLQIYFTGQSEDNDQVQQRRRYNNVTKQ